MSAGNHPYPHQPPPPHQAPATQVPQAPRAPQQVVPSPSSASGVLPLTLSFGPSTTVSDLTYFAERGCVVPLLSALDTPRLKTLGARMLADYAKMSARRAAVAGNRRILEFLCRTMLEDPLGPQYLHLHGSSRHSTRGSSNGSGAVGECDLPTWESSETGPGWPAREYAVETVRSLTATEESDSHLMNCPGLLRTLALAARGGPFANVRSPSPSSTNPADPSGENGGAGGETQTQTLGAASPKARLHACIAVMNLSCGKSNKVEIASVPEILAAMRDVMAGRGYPPRARSPDNGKAMDEARLKAVTCVKNLSNADANDAALLGTPGLVEALGRVALDASSGNEDGTGMANAGAAATATTNACLALMNLSISKSNKHRVFRTPGVMDALMAVITRTCPDPSSSSDPAGGRTTGNFGASSSANDEARVKACSALSNLAIGYDNKIPMFAYPGFVDSILRVIDADDGEARTKACSILWSFAAEMKNQVPVVQRGDILPTLVRVAKEDGTTEARFKCVAALTLLAESLENAVPLLEAGALCPLMDILHRAGPDPTQWKGQTASWCVGFLMNIAQADEAVPCLREAGVVELLAPLLTLDHYQSLKAAMAVTFVCRYDEGDETYDLLRKTENVIPKIISLLHNTLSGRGGNGYKYGVFTLRSSVGCISSLASGPDFMKERIATGPVFESLLRVLSDFCVEGGTDGAIVGGGRDDALSATLAMRAMQGLTSHLIPAPGSTSLPFGPEADERLLTALESFEACPHPDIADGTRRLATDSKLRILGSKNINHHRSNPSGGGGGIVSSCQGGESAAAAAVSAAMKHMTSGGSSNLNTSDEDMEDLGAPSPTGTRNNSSGTAASSLAASLASGCCGLPTMGEISESCFPLSVHDMMMAGMGPCGGGYHNPNDPFGFNVVGAPQVTEGGEAPLTKPKGLEIIELDETSASSAGSSSNASTPASSPIKSADCNTNTEGGTNQEEPAVRTFLLSDARTGRRFAVPTDPSGGRRFNDGRLWCYRRGRFCDPQNGGESPDPDYVWTAELQAAYDAAVSAQRGRRSPTTTGGVRGGGGPGPGPVPSGATGAAVSEALSATTL